MASVPPVDLRAVRNLDDRQVARAIYKLDVMLAVSQLTFSELAEVAALCARLQAARQPVADALPFVTGG